MVKLTTYNKKRDFENTDEPKGAPSVSKRKSAHKLRFVVQRHHASRLHYDFRLELDGVLKSWAVPKGPSLYPKDKRLAMQVEDHPIDYASFEGSIPKGNYGAGTVHIFDSGYYEFSEAKDEAEFLKNWRKGSLKFKLFGHILRGEFALVQMKGDEGKAWLLIKHQDRYATDAPYNSEDCIADSIKEAGIVFKEQPPPKPMLTKLVDKLPTGGDWVYEKKYDGFRIIGVRSSQAVHLYSRSGKSMNHLFPSIVQELAALDKEVCVDGELLIEDMEGRSHFQLIASGEPVPSTLHLRYYVFDILRLENEVLNEYTLVQRKELLRLLLKRLKKIKFIKPVEELQGDIDTLRQKAEQQNWEGIIAKEKESRYLEGIRNAQWVKYKLRHSQEAIICGYTTPQGNRSHFGALVLGMYKEGVLTYIGNCGTGFDEALLESTYKRMKRIVSDKKPFPKAIHVAKEKDVTWLSPELICEVYYSEWTSDKHLRHPVFKMLRTDKKPREIESEELLPMENKDESITIGNKTVQLTNLDKVYWPQDNYIKGQMIAYYEEMADHMLPYLKDKPISLHRFPNGIDADSFFQKDVDPDKIPDWVKTVPIHAESTGKDIDYIICNDKATLLYIANLGSIEINPWLATYKNPENPDFAVLDLDPNGADFEEVIRVAKLAKEFLDKMGASSFVKTSGSTGMHIYLYVAKKYDYDIVRDFIQLLAEMLHERCLETTSIVRDPKKRKGMIYLDFLQNRRGQTIASPYSLRPKEGATVSAPLDWSEVRPGLDIKSFTIKSMLKRVKEIKDPWAGIWSSPVDIKKSLKRLG
ncbi:DNA ligase D [Sphingobacterium sp. DK4209]|uniref:DNA ligase (ATP) n=1 Tax=Sphingobacterium zhuxiongii TaxID=2662364 RepID=A0A5Q0Q6Z1_9SPHI|nr:MULTISPECIES: DNA ligase D [unclassified Sphingobacterium]MVZ67431.1 DNA ligase D [Sphingobacterium sp. DK4209]QGA24869.1 DNA ligase D [Sphingobacterium sp. dk4302]